MNNENAAILREFAPTATAVSQSDQVNVVASLRSSSSLEQRQELTFSDVSEVIVFLRRTGRLSEKVFWLGYNVEHEPCVRVELEQALDALEKRSTILSLDGFVICNDDYTSGVIADYEEVTETRSSGEVYLSLLGHWAKT